MIQYRIVAVPERAGHATALRDQVGGVLIMDTAHEGPFKNHQNALRSATGTHVVVLEDDAIPCPDFAEHVERLVAQRPTHLIGLYVGRSHPRRIQRLLTNPRHDGEWLAEPLVESALRWGVGYVMPVADIPDVLTALEAGGQHPWLATDTRLGAWHAAQGRVSYAWPSPVDHNDALPSTTTSGKSVRVAHLHCKGA